MVVTAGDAVVDGQVGHVTDGAQFQVDAPVALSVVVPLDKIVEGIAVAVITGVGLTVMVYVTDGPLHAPNVGVTVIVAVIGDPVEFVATNEGTFPVPLAARPIAVLEFVQV